MKVDTDILNRWAARFDHPDAIQMLVGLPAVFYLYHIVCWSLISVLFSWLFHFRSQQIPMYHSVMSLCTAYSSLHFTMIPMCAAIDIWPYLCWCSLISPHKSEYIIFAVSYGALSQFVVWRDLQTLRSWDHKSVVDLGVFRTLLACEHAWLMDFCQFGLTVLRTLGQSWLVDIN